MSDVDPNYGDLYRAKPIEVRAVKVTKVNIKKVARWCGGDVIDDEAGLSLRTNDGEHAVPGEDYVCRTPEGDFFVEDVESFEFNNDLVEVTRV